MIRLIIVFLSAFAGLVLSACDLLNPNIFLTVTRPDQNETLTITTCSLDGGVETNCNDNSPTPVFESTTNVGALSDTVGIFLSGGKDHSNQLRLKLAQSSSSDSHHCDLLDIIALAPHLTRIDLRLSGTSCQPIDFNSPQDCGKGSCSFHANGCGTCGQ